MDTEIACISNKQSNSLLEGHIMPTSDFLETPLMRSHEPLSYAEDY